jgi:hypothetical protein
MSDCHRVQQTIELVRPEIQEFSQPGKMGMEVFLLPDEILQDPRMVGHVIKNVCRSQAVALEFAANIGAGHAGSPDSVSDGVISNASWQSFVSQKSCHISLLASRPSECYLLCPAGGRALPGRRGRPPVLARMGPSRDAIIRRAGGPSPSYS